MLHVGIFKDEAFPFLRLGPFRSHANRFLGRSNRRFFGKLFAGWGSRVWETLCYCLCVYRKQGFCLSLALFVFDVIFWLYPYLQRKQQTSDGQMPFSWILLTLYSSVTFRSDSTSVSNVFLQLEVISPPLGFMCAWHRLTVCLCSWMWTRWLQNIIGEYVDFFFKPEAEQKCVFKNPHIGADKLFDWVKKKRCSRLPGNVSAPVPHYTKISALLSTFVPLLKSFITYLDTL